MTTIDLDLPPVATDLTRVDHREHGRRLAALGRWTGRLLAEAAGQAGAMALVVPPVDRPAPERRP